MAKIRDMIPAFELLQPETVEDAMELLDSTEEVLEDNSIRKQGSDRFMDIWED